MFHHTNLDAFWLRATQSYPLISTKIVIIIFPPSQVQIKMSLRMRILCFDGNVNLK